jgi:hypothetical protein
VYEGAPRDTPKTIVSEARVVIWSVLGVLLVTLIMVFLPVYIVAKVLFGPPSTS